MAVYLVVWGVILAEAAQWQGAALAAVLPTKGAATWQAALWTLLYALAFLVYWLLALVLALVVASPAMAPILGLLAEVVEEADFGTPPRSVTWSVRLREAVHGVARAALLALLQLGGAALIWALGALVSLLLPPVGAFISVVLGGGWGAWWLAATVHGFCFENHHIGVGRQLGLMTRAMPLLLGFGVTAQLIAWVPLALPLLVISATLLAGRLHRHGYFSLALRAASRAAPPTTGTSVAAPTQGAGPSGAEAGESGHGASAQARKDGAG